MKTYLVTFNRLPYPPIQQHPEGPDQVLGQPLAITVKADTEAQAVMAANSIINTQIRGGPAPGIPSNGTTHKIRGGSPRLYSLASVKVISYK